MPSPPFEMPTPDLPSTTSESHSTSQAPQTPSVITDASAKRFCDAVFRQFNLTSTQLSDLRQFVELGLTVDPSLLKLYIWQQGSIYSLMNRLEVQVLDYNRFNELLEGINERFSMSFTLSKEQTKNVMTYAKDYLYQPGRTDFIDGLNRDVESHLRKNAQRLGLKDIFNNPAKEQALKKVIRDKTSSARNQFRIIVIQSVQGDARCSLENATYIIAEKFKKGGPGDLGFEYQLFVALIRRFLWDFYYRTPSESPDPAVDLDEPVNPDDEEQTRKHKRPRTVGNGRIRKGEDFWSKFQTFLQSMVKQNGNDLKATGWQLYFSSIVRRDIASWGSEKGTLLNPLPLTYTEGDSWTAMASTTIHHHSVPSRHSSPRLGSASGRSSPHFRSPSSHHTSPSHSFSHGHTMDVSHYSSHSSHSLSHLLS
ncbi:hypothetical protein C8Q75DRAFT_806596 [Abortiporus biennis]|nr:hypothetical protein C8Q75DRAFT_811543 [Abortiporus biennis]KAI0789941.1 hypothetical protein C8Q75DRAFT_806596 [Abortiporus biennis]